MGPVLGLTAIHMNLSKYSLTDEIQEVCLRTYTTF